MITMGQNTGSSPVCEVQSGSSRNPGPSYGKGYHLRSVRAMQSLIESTGPVVHYQKAAPSSVSLSPQLPEHFDNSDWGGCVAVSSPHSVHVNTPTRPSVGDHSPTPPFNICGPNTNTHWHTSPSVSELVDARPISPIGQERHPHSEEGSSGSDYGWDQEAARACRARSQERVNRHRAESDEPAVRQPKSGRKASHL